MFYTIRQNNSGGTWTDTEGLNVFVIIEADSQEAAEKRALDIGIYFDGVENGHDCPCCGDRWSRRFDAYDTPQTYGEPVELTSEGDVTIHYLDGHIQNAQSA